MKHHLAIYVFFLSIFVSALNPLHAMGEGQMSLGLAGGQVGLTGDVANVDKAGGLGWAIMAGYSVRSDILFNLQYQRADLGKVEHGGFTAGGDFFLMGPDTMRPYLSGGVGLYSNTVDYGFVGLTKLEPSAQAFGIYAGGGVDFELTHAVSFGLQGRYNFIFDANDTSNGVERAVIQDTYSVLARVLFTFGASKPW